MGREKDRFEELLDLLPEDWEAKAKELGALLRAREIKTAEELLRLILLYLTEGKSFRGTSALMQLSGEAQLSDVAILKRFRNCGDWLQWLCENIYRKSGLIVAKPEWLQGKNVKAVDASEVVKCGAVRECHMLHYCLDLFTLSPHELLVTDIKTGEKLTNFKMFGEDDIVMGDRMYGTLPGIAYLQEQGAGYVLRLKPSGFTMYNERKQEITITNRFSGLKRGEFGDYTAYCIINKQYVPIRICAMRKDKQSEEDGIKRLIKENQRKCGGKAVTKQQRESNKYIMVMTSLGEEVSTAQVLELYRLRWQIEIAFKRLKSLFEYNELPSKNSQSVKAWFYGKLLLAALCETLVNAGRFSPSGERSRRR